MMAILAGVPPLDRVTFGAALALCAAMVGLGRAVVRHRRTASPCASPVVNCRTARSRCRRAEVGDHSGALAGYNAVVGSEGAVPACHRAAVGYRSATQPAHVRWRASRQRSVWANPVARRPRVAGQPLHRPRHVTGTAEADSTSGFDLPYDSGGKSIPTGSNRSHHGVQ